MFFLPDEDLTKELIEGPEKIVDVMKKKDIDKKDPLSYTKTLKTYLFDNEITAIIYASDQPNASKFGGTVEWIGDRRDDEKGTEFFIRSRSEGRVLSFGINNVKVCNYNPHKRSFNIIQNPVTCPVCNKPILPDQSTISCPNCHVVAHKEDYLEYLKLKGECPACAAKLTLKGK